MHSYAYPSVSGPTADMPVSRKMEAVSHLVGAGFTLDRLEAGDTPRLEVLSQDEEFQRWLPWVRGGFTKESAREFAEDFSRNNWASGQPVWAVRIDGELVGVVDLRDRGEGAFEIGFWMHPDVRGKGVMTAACVLVVQAAFDSLGATRILHFARVGNDRSLRIARNLGFAPEGIRRKPTRSGVERQWQSSLLLSDWKRRGSAAHMGVPTPDVLDGGRPSALVAELMSGAAPAPSSTPPPTATAPPPSASSSAVPSRQIPPVPPNPAPADMAARVVLGVYGVAEELGVDLEAALSRAHWRKLSEQARR